MLRGEAAERKRLADLEAARQQRLRWEAAMRQAHIDYAETCRVKRLEAQAEAWRHATRLSDYVTAVRAQVEALPTGQEKTRADAHLQRLNPLGRTPQLPDVPEPRPDDLRPFPPLEPARPQLLLTRQGFGKALSQIPAPAGY